MLDFIEFGLFSKLKSNVKRQNKKFGRRLKIEYFDPSLAKISFKKCLLQCTKELGEIEMDKIKNMSTIFTMGKSMLKLLSNYKDIALTDTHICDCECVEGNFNMFEGHVMDFDCQVVDNVEVREACLKGAKFIPFFPKK